MKARIKYMGHGVWMCAMGERWAVGSTPVKAYAKWLFVR